MQLYQDQALSRLLKHTYEHVLYYRNILEKIKSKDNQNFDRRHFEQMPILDKEMIRTHFNILVSDDSSLRNPYVNTSGGSTGEPVKFIQDKEYFQKNFGDKILFGLLNGKLPGDRELKIWGSEQDMLEGTIGKKEKLINLVFNRHFVNSFILDRNTLTICVEKLNNLRPVQVWTYAESVYELACFILREKLSVFCPKNIVTTAGVLYTDMRKKIKEAFPKSNVINQYGSREVGAIGIETCGKEGMRIFNHSVLLEVAKDDGSIGRDGYGRLLVTSLINYSMPIIRFDIGDIGEIESTSHEYTGSFSVLKRLTGRVNAHIKKKNGDLIHGEYFTHLFYGKDWVKVFQVIQHAFDVLEFKIVIQDGCKKNDDDITKMINDTHVVMGSGCDVKVSFVDEIHRQGSGKYQFVLSKV